MKQGFALRISQHLALTPQLQQSIRLLQLSTLELNQEIEQMLDDNPFLERNPEQAAREEFGLPRADEPVRDAVGEAGSTSDSPFESASSTAVEADTPDLTGESEPLWEGDGTFDMAPDDSEWGGDAPARGPVSTHEESDVDATALTGTRDSLTDHLLRQIAGLRLSANDNAALRFLIGSLDDDGYLEDPLDSLARGLAGTDEAAFEELLHHFRVALGLLHNLEPVGVGARDLSECLCLQLRAQQPSAEQLPVRALALRICGSHLDWLARRDVKKLSLACAETETAVKAAMGLIARLEPKPGRRFLDVERNIVVPDVLVSRLPGAGQARFRVQLNPDVMPRLRVHDIYANALRQHKAGSRDAAGYSALNQRLQEARWFIKNIQQRFDTILRVSSAIVERQKNFFVHGELAMRPLVLREIADELGLHESTISRVTTAKYMATPLGTYELKYFFGSALGTEAGGNASSTAVRALIRQFVAAENAGKPLSDSQMSEMLKEQGIECARRTVAKYREALRIAPTHLRKTL